MITITPDIWAVAVSPNLSVKPMFIPKYADLADKCLTFSEEHTIYICVIFVFGVSDEKHQIQVQYLLYLTCLNKHTIGSLLHGLEHQ